MMNAKELELKLSDALQREDVLKQQLAESQREFRAADATIENMQMQFEKLAAESAGLKAAAKETLAHWAAAEAGKMELMMDKCMPGLRDAYCETPATEAVLAEVRAQGVEMFARETEKLEWHESTVRFVLKFAAQLRKGGAA